MTVYVVICEYQGEYSNSTVFASETAAEIYIMEQNANSYSGPFGYSLEEHEVYE